MNINKMIRVSTIVFVIVSSYQCNTATKAIHQYNVVRNNYFSNSYKLPLQDTNKVNRHLYASVFDKIKLEDGARCLLLKIYFLDKVWEEYGLYDYANKKFYYSSIKDNTLYEFKEMNTSKDFKMYTKLTKFATNLELLLRQPYQQSSTLIDGSCFEASLMNVDILKKEIVVKTYYW